MSKYTIQVRQMIRTKPSELFDFEYDFYDIAFKDNFERKFIEAYYFDEIGTPPIDRFKFMLKSKLNRIMPYYKQLYQTEIEGKKINFLLNKDLKETFIRELDNIANVKSNMKNINTTNSNDVNTSYDSATPEGSISDIEKYMTSASKTNDTNNSNSQDDNNASADTITKGTEKTTLNSQGNIGVTSSGQLMEDWRKILLNIDELIINECRDLFMLVY